MTTSRLIASCLGFLAVTAVGGLAWLSQAAMALLPVAQWAHVEPARHTVFRYAAYLAGGTTQVLRNVAGERILGLPRG